MLVNLSEGKISKEPTASYSDNFLGGRGINIKLLYDGVPPEVGPLDPASLLIFGVGPLAGTPVPAARTEVTAKSPETGFLGSSNFGGYFGPELKFAGYDNIVITGKGSALWSPLPIMGVWDMKLSITKEALPGVLKLMLLFALRDGFKIIGALFSRKKSDSSQ